MLAEDESKALLVEALIVTIVGNYMIIYSVAKGTKTAEQLRPA